MKKITKRPGSALWQEELIKFFAQQSNISLWALFVFYTKLPNCKFNFLFLLLFNTHFSWDFSIPSEANAIKNPTRPTAADVLLQQPIKVVDGN